MQGEFKVWKGKYFCWKLTALQHSSMHCLQGPRVREGAPGGQPGVEVKSDRDDEDDDDQEDQDDQDVEEDVHVKEEEEKERIGEEVKTETKSETRDSIERKTEEPGGEGTEQSDAVKSEVRVKSEDDQATQVGVTALNNDPNQGQAVKTEVFTQILSFFFHFSDFEVKFCLVKVKTETEVPFPSNLTSSFPTPAVVASRFSISPVLLRIIFLFLQFLIIL